MSVAKETTDNARAQLTPDCIVIEIGDDLYSLVKNGAPLAFDGKRWTLCIPLIAEMVEKTVKRRFAKMYREILADPGSCKNANPPK